MAQFFSNGEYESKSTAINYFYQSNVSNGEDLNYKKMYLLEVEKHECT
jgi:hypothetical protein